MSRPHEEGDGRAPGPGTSGARGEPRLALSPPLLVVCGPTGTGKSDVAIALAERLGGEVIGCDALQVYQGFDVGTAKPGAAELARVPHHLVSHVDPRRDYSMADYVRDADAAILAVAARGRVPIVAGGTGMYLRGLLRGVVAAPARDPRLRERLRRMLARHGSARLHRWLRRVDPGSAERLPPADAQRIVRALEIALAGGGTWTERLSFGGSWSSGVERHRALKVVLDLPREVLAARLDARVEAFFARGLVAEVRSLLAEGVPASANAFKAIGYREVLRAIEQGSDPAAVVDDVRRATRRYAKRQRTWFRGEGGALHLDASRGIDATAATIVASWRSAGF